MAIDAGLLGVRAVLDRAATLLRRAGVPEGCREAVRILASLRGEAPGEVFASEVESLDPADAAAFRAAVSRRAGGEPLAYVTGHAGFRYLDVEVDGSTLIPRPETEGLVEVAASLVRAAGATTVADIGTGSGCIALSLASELGVRVVAVELSGAALAIARRNAAALGVPVQFVQGDLTTALADVSCDVLVSNPPYLSAAEHAALDPAVRVWEPALALASGDDGMTATDRILVDARRVVRAGGWIALEVDCTRGRLAGRRAQELGWRDVTIENDLFGRERYLLARRHDA